MDTPLAREIMGPAERDLSWKAIFVGVFDSCRRSQRFFRNDLTGSRLRDPSKRFKPCHQHEAKRYRSRAYQKPAYAYFLKSSVFGIILKGAFFVFFVYFLLNIFPESAKGGAILFATAVYCG